MARSRGTKEYLPPLKGLNTSSSPRTENEEYFTDGVNILYREGPVRLEPRKAHDIEKLISEDDAPISYLWQEDISYGEWRGPNDEVGKSFIWVKVADLLYFIDVETGNTHSEIIDLNDFLSDSPEGNNANLSQTGLEAKNVKGNLLLVNPAIDPTVISYDGTNMDAYVLELKIRDMLGIEDGLGVSERPATLEDEHEYNLYNQGWHKSRRVTAGGAPVDPVANFFTDQGIYPSNADISHLAVVDDGAGEILFDSDFLLDLSFGSTPAPRGHYVFPAFNIDREERRLDPSITGLETGGSGGASDVVGNPNGPPIFPADPYDPNDEDGPPDYTIEE